MIKRKLLTGTIVLTTFCSTLVPYSALAANKKVSLSAYSTNFNKQKVKYNNIEYDYQVLQDDENIRKVEVTAEDGTSIAEYNKKTGEYNVVDSKGEKFNSKIDQKVVNSTQIAKLSVDITNIYLQSESVWNSKCKVDKYIYTYPSSTKYVWYIATSTNTGKSVMESSSNRGDLESFKSAVKSTKANEISAAAALGGAYAAGIAALLTAAPTLGMSAIIAILGSVGAVGTGAVLLWQAYDAHGDAIYYYNRV